MTMTWRVDDLKVSHVGPKEGTKFCLELSNIYRKGLTVTQGKVHTYLVKDFNYSTDREFKVSMIKYAKQIEEDFTDAITTIVPSPAADHLFQVHYDGE